MALVFFVIVSRATPEGEALRRRPHGSSGECHGRQRVAFADLSEQTNFDRDQARGKAERTYRSLVLLQRDTSIYQIAQSPCANVPSIIKMEISMVALPNWQFLP